MKNLSGSTEGNIKVGQGPKDWVGSWLYWNSPNDDSTYDCYDYHVIQK